MSRTPARWLTVVVGLLALIAVAWMLRHANSAATNWHSFLSVAAGLITVSAVAVRGRYALLALAAVAGLALASSSGPALTLPIVLITFVVALRANAAELALAAPIALAGLLGSVAIHGPVSSSGFVSRAVAVGLAMAAGLYAASRRAHVATLHDRTLQLEREQQLLTEHAVAAERVRIARELHDVVAHGVSLMVVQAQALGALGGTERDAAGARIATIGRDALAEMHRMLGVLRPQSDELPELAPTPGIAELGALVARARGAGLDVSLEVEGQPRALPAGADLSAYRIVQEAITNVIKHARASRADVRVRYASDALELSVVDDGAGPDPDGSPGHGLLGMRERVALFGGTLEAGADGGGRGYAVHAVLPL